MVLQVLHATTAHPCPMVTAPCAQDGAGCRAWIWPPPVSGVAGRRRGPHADTARLGRKRWRLAWGGASPSWLARAGMDPYGTTTARGSPPYWWIPLQPAARNRPKQAESAYPRPRDRRLSHKTRATVGRPPGSTSVENAVRSADSPGANPLPVRQRENTSTPTAVANHNKWAQHRPSSISH